MRKRKVIAIFLFATVGVAIVLTWFAWPSGSLIELKLVGVKPLGSFDGKKLVQLTLYISHASRGSLLFNPVEDIQAKVRSQWIEVDQRFDLGQVSAGKTVQKRFIVVEEAEACQLRFDFYVDQQPISPRCQVLYKLGPWAVNLVRKSPFGEWLFDEWETGSKEVTLQVEIPQASRHSPR